MPSLVSRITELERLANRLIASQAPKVSELLCQGRRQLLTGRLPPPLPVDIVQLERDAAQASGLRGEVARAELRLLRGLEPLLSACQASEDGRGTSESTLPTLPSPENAPTGPGEALAREIDMLVARHA